MELPFSHALRTTFQQGYNFQTFRKDLIAGLVVSLIALPLAMALAIAVGLPPQYGIYTAIAAGIITPLFGGSMTQVSGPTAAFVVIVAPIVTQYGLRGLIIAEILAGILLLIFALGRLGRFISYVPYPVTTGFTAGIAVVLGTLALNDFLGLGVTNLQGEFIEKVIVLATHMGHMQWQEVLIGVSTLTTILFIQHRFPKFPASILGVALGTLLAFILVKYGMDIATIGNRFSYETAEGIMKKGIPPFPPTIHFFNTIEGDLFAWPTHEELRSLMVPAMVIAALAALESLLSATVADGMAGTKHRPNQELFGIGLGNIISGFTSGIPATGAIARTATNINAGAKTPFSAVFHAIFIMLYVLLLSSLIAYIPMASLAALLIVTAIHMSHYKQFFHTIHIAPRSDTAVLLVCFGLTVFIDMVAGVTVGIMLACFLFMQRISSLTETSLSTSGESNSGTWDIILPKHVMIYHIDGPLFFGTVEKAFDRYSFIHDHITILIIDMEKVPLIDMSGLVAMKKLLSNVAREERKVILCGKKTVVKKIFEEISPETARYVQGHSTVKQALGMIKEEWGVIS